MTSLEETLPALSAAIPEIPGQMAGLIEEGNAASAASKALLEEMAEKRREATELFNQILQAVAGVEQVAAGSKARLEAEGAGLEAVVASCRQGLEEGGHQLARVVDDAEGSMTDLAGDLRQSASRTTEAEDGCGQAVDQLARMIANRQEELEPAVEAAAAQARDLAQAVQEAQTLVSGGLQTLRQRMRELLEEGRREVESTGATLRKSASTHEDHLLAEGGRLSQAKQELLKRISDRVGEEIAQRVATEAAKVQVALGRLDQTLRQAEQGTHEDADALESKLAGLSDAMEPLPPAIDSIKQAAREVGLLWG
jgi:uncharacterized phage infection (PIP) family protein YhgE